MKNETIKKINTLGKVGYIICKIGKIAMMIATIACLVGAVLMCFVPKEAVKIELTTSNTAVFKLDDSYDLSKILDLDIEDGILEIGDNTYSVVGGADAPETITKTVYISDFKWILFAATLGCFSVLVAFYFAEKLCKSFKDCETPFTEEVSGVLMKFAYSLIGVGALGMIGESVVNSLFTNKFMIGIDIDLGTVLLILCVFMLSFIFKHGTALQVQSDETL